MKKKNNKQLFELGIILLVLLVVSNCGNYVQSSSPIKIENNDNNNNSGYFWHITDPHLDSEYSLGSSVECGELICCRKSSPIIDNSTSGQAGRFGSYGPCDIPLETFMSALDFVKNYPLEASFVFYGGDNLAHDDWNYSKEHNLNYALLVTNALRSGLSGSKFQNRILPTVGNHDLAPINLYPLNPSMNSWYLNPVGDSFQFSFNSFSDGSEALNLFKQMGYYSILLEPGFRAVIINTQFSNPLNFWLLSTTDKDPGQQLAWLNVTLAAAQAANEKVIILGHIPPGISTESSMEEGTGEFNLGMSNIVERFSSIIVGQFYGHTHDDHVKVFKDVATSTKPTGVAFVTPAVTQWEEHNPAFRLVQYNKQTFQLENIYTFVANLTQANLDGKITWNLEYDFINGYGLSDLSPDSINSLIFNQLNPVKEQWEKFALRFGASYPKNVCHFENSCKLRKVCSMGNILYSGYDRCLKANGKQL